jgi:uroporphyrinogen decarboxylase
MRSCSLAGRGGRWNLDGPRDHETRHTMEESIQLTPRERLHRALRCEVVDRPPVWLMRQAGRALPEYLALKQTHSFVQLVQSPELSTEVTLQPIRRFGFDAAILFSDILVICEAMGQPYHFRESGGVELAFPIRTTGDIDRLEPAAVVERLQYVARALALTRRELGPDRGLLGFVGAPWTLANFMIEGGSSKEFVRARELFYSDRPLFERLMEKLTVAVTAFAQLQIEAGVDALQIFDSSGGLLAGNAYHDASGKYIARIVAGMAGRVPAIVFARGVHDQWERLAGLGGTVLGVDWTVALSDVRCRVPASVGLQGNLDPQVLTLSPKIAAEETRRVLEEMRGRPGHIFNLGHGLLPASRLDSIESLVQTVVSFRCA